MTPQQLAQQLLPGNPGAILTGSLALNLQGLATRRPPTDIDILMPVGSGFSFTLLPGQTMERIKRTAPEANTEKGEDYSEPLYERVSYTFRDGLIAIKIDVFHALDAEAFTRRAAAAKHEKGLRLDDPRAILASKVAYALDPFSTDATRAKHRADVIYFLSL